MTNEHKVLLSAELFELIINTVAQEVPYAVAAALLERVEGELSPKEESSIIQPH